MFFLIVSVLSVQTAFAEECVNTYSLEGCGEVVINIDNGLEILQHKALRAKEGDDDKDSVLNNSDKCPNTPVGLEVNQEGCPQAKELVINFESDVYKIAQSDHEKVSEFAHFLNANPYYEALITGHTDDVDTDEYNLRLSKLRAQELKELLVIHGVAKNRLSIKGMGESSPINDNLTLMSRFENRRAIVLLTHQGEQVNSEIYESKE